MRHHRLLSLFIILGFISGCTLEHQSAQKAPTSIPLSVRIRNITRRTLYAACFTYLKKEESPRWRWQKTNVYELAPDREVTILIDTFKSKRAIPDALGVLGVFTTYEEADAAVYELMPDQNKIDLDRLLKLQDKTVVLGIEKYGVVGDIFDYSFISDQEPAHDSPPLDFMVENKTGKPLYASAFVYEKSGDSPIWNYEKSPVVHILPNHTETIKVDPIASAYDRKYARAFLAVFDESERKEAYASTFQLLKSHQSINVGLLSSLAGRRVILNEQKYGILGDVIDFVVKEPRKISNSKSENIKDQPRYS